jgi:glucokinase
MTQQPKLAVSIDDDTIKMAWVAEGERLSAAQVWPIRQFNTLTDALLAYEKKAGIPLLGAACALSVMGATFGETIMVSRSSWAISRSGLRTMFGYDVIALNNVAASAWAALNGGLTKLEGLSSAAIGEPDFHRSGRWVLSNIDSGVGLAVIDVDDAGIARVLECEMGHCGFAPATREDRALAAALAGPGDRPVSWEMALTVSPDDPVWREPGLPSERAERAAMIARLAGRYIGDTVLAHGAWSGAILMGNRVGELLTESTLPGFNAAYEKIKYRRLVRSAPRWRLVGQNITLSGCAAVLGRQNVPQSPAASRSWPIASIH